MRRRLPLLACDTRGVVMVEFAFLAPIILMLGLVGIEMANLATTHLRISQAAMHLADNAARAGTRGLLSVEEIYESDINDLFVGVNVQAGRQIGLFEHGRVILSSLERNADGGQTIKWQRCMGTKQVQSAYGPEGTGATGTAFAGMGQSGQELQAETNEAVMFVEVIYDYQPILANSLVSSLIQSPEIKATAAFTVRTDRDLSGIHQGSTPAPVATCDKFGTEP